MIVLSLVIVDALLLVLAVTLAIRWWTGGVRAGADRDRALRELADEARLERALREVAAAAASEVAQPELAALVAARLRELLGASTAAVIRADPDCLLIIGYSGPEPYPQRLGWDEASSSLQAVRTGQPARLEDYGPPGGEVAAIEAQGLSCGISVPVRISGRVWGCITVTTARDGGFTVGHEAWLERFASMVSAALANAQAQTQLRRDAQLERALREVAVASVGGALDERALGQLVAERVAELLGVAASGVWRFDERWVTKLGYHGDAEIPDRMALGEPSVAEQVRVTGAPARLGSDVALAEGACAEGAWASFTRVTGVRHAIGVPVIVEGELWGAVSAGSTEAEIDPAAESSLRRFAELVSVALANAQAQSRLREEARLQSALREVAAASGGGESDADAVFALVAARVAALLDADAAMVVRLERSTGRVLAWNGAAAIPSELALEHSAAASRAISTGRAARVEDYQALDGKPASQLTAATTGYRTAVVAPAYLHGSPWGYIAVANTKPSSFPSNAESILERFAALVTLALAQADSLAELKRQARTDGLTGLLNHRAFQQRLREEFARARRHDRPLSLVMFDLDNLKLVNDLHGHSAGDRAIETVGRVLREGERTDDVAARVGGDEFAVIAPETTAPDALALAERLRVTAAARLAQLELPASVSAGVSDLTHAETINELFRHADSALYAAKHNAGDQAVCYTPSVENDLAVLDLAVLDADRRRAAHPRIKSAANPGRPAIGSSGVGSTRPLAG